MAKIFFCSFADSSMKSALLRIGKQAAELDVFDNIKLYTEKELPHYGYKKIKNIIRKTKSKKGYGFWAWKPIIINDMFKNMAEGDILLYSDAGTHINKNGKAKFLEYVEQAKKNDIWVIQLESKHQDIIWAKKDLVNYFLTRAEQIEDFNAKIIEGQLEGGTVLLVKNDYTLSVINQWEHLMSVENCHLFDDSPSVAPNISDFKENRHDQAVLSLLLKSNHYYSTDISHFWASNKEGWNKLRENEPFLRLRDIQKKKTIKSVLRRLIPCKIFLL